MDIKAEFFSAVALLQEDSFRVFNSKIVHAVLPVNGVRTPHLRRLAKQFAAYDPNDIVAYLSAFSPDTFEEQIFGAFLLSADKHLTFEKKLQLLTRMIPTFDNWAVVDQFTSAFHEVKKNQERMLAFLEPYQTGGEFEQRLVAVMLLTYYLEEPYIQTACDILSQLQNPAYYTKMAVAWAVATMAAKTPDAAFTLLDGRLDRWIHNKAIQKAIESYRVSDQNKAKLKTMKRR